MTAVTKRNVRQLSSASRNVCQIPTNLEAPCDRPPIVVRTYLLHERTKILASGRRIAAAMFAGLALGLATPASAVPPDPATQMTGHYITTMTNSTGRSTTSDWYFSSCGDGCASVVLMPSGSAGAEARLVNGQWTMDKEGQSTCWGDTRVLTSQHWTWDPNTSTGTVDSTYEVPACGLPKGYKTTSNVTFRKAPY